LKKKKQADEKTGHEGLFVLMTKKRKTVATDRV
jgi:hypothetical protein